MRICNGEISNILGDGLATNFPLKLLTSDNNGDADAGSHDLGPCNEILKLSVFVNPQMYKSNFQNHCHQIINFTSFSNPNQHPVLADIFTPNIKFQSYLNDDDEEELMFVYQCIDRYLHNHCQIKNIT